MALSALTGAFVTTFRAQPQQDSANPLVAPLSTQATINKNSPVSNAVANTVTAGADEAFSFQQAISAGSSATIDLTAMTNMVNATAVAIVRLKAGFQVRLLSAGDDPSISPAPNAASTVTVTNIGPEVPANLNFGNAGTGLTLTLTVVATIVTAVAIGAAGSGYPKSAGFLVSPVQAGGSGCVIAVITNSSGVPTSVVFIAGGGGTGYTAATVPSIVVGQFTLTTGNALCGIDVTAAGISVSSTKKNIKLLNNDGANAVTCELDFFAGTT